MYVEKKQTGGKVEMVMTKQNQLKTEKNKIKSMLITLVNSSTSVPRFTTGGAVVPAVECVQ